MKKTFSFILVSLTVFSLLLPFSAYAKSDEAHVSDEAGVLTSKEASELNSLLEEYSKEINCDIVVYTILSYYGDEDDLAKLYQEDHAEKAGYENAVLFFLNLDDGAGRYANIYAMGKKAEDAYGDIDETFEDAFDQIVELDYYKSFRTFADSARSTFKSFPTKTAIKRAIIAVIAGLIIAWAVTSSMKSKLRTVSRKYEAADYVRPGSLNVTQSQDVYLYSNTVRTAKPSDSSRSGGGGGYSSSGTHHSSGSGRHF